MASCPVDQQKRLLLSVALSALLTGIVLTAIYTYSATQVRALSSQTAYANPEDGMRALIADSYTGVSKVEILHADKEIFEDLWFVEARVRAASRVDGKAFSGQDSDNPGSFFLRVHNGWVFVPEGKCPELIALGVWLFGLRDKERPE